MSGELKGVLRGGSGGKVFLSCTSEGELPGFLGLLRVGSEWPEEAIGSAGGGGSSPGLGHGEAVVVGGETVGEVRRELLPVAGGCVQALDGGGGEEGVDAGCGGAHGVDDGEGGVPGEGEGQALLLPVVEAFQPFPWGEGELPKSGLPVQKAEQAGLSP